MADKLRIDKYLWSIRVFKTRTLAAEACKAGRVKKDGTNLKASYEVKIGDQLHVSKGLERKVIRVIDLLHSRVDAKKAILYYEDITPEEETLKYKSMFAPVFERDRGTGRPTKKDRRDIDDLKSNFFDEEDD